MARESTTVAAPPPPPIIISASITRKTDQDATAVVRPLPSPLEPPPKGSRGRSMSERLIVDGAAGPKATSAEATGAGTTGRADRHGWTRLKIGLLGAAVAIAAVLVVTIGFSNGGVKRDPGPADLEPAATSSDVAPRPAPSASEHAMPASEPAPAAEITAQAPADPPAAAEAAAQAPAEPPPAEVAVQAPAEPAPAKPRRLRATAAASSRSEDPPPRPSRLRAKIAQAAPARATSTHEPARAKPEARPRTKPARPLTYDPDALFLKKP